MKNRYEDRGEICSEQGFFRLFYKFFCVFMCKKDTCFFTNLLIFNDVYKIRLA